MKIIKPLIKSVINSLPDEGRMIKLLVMNSKMKTEITMANLAMRLKREILPNPYTVYWIDPKRIQFHTNYKVDSSDWEDWVFDQKKIVSQVQYGDWDNLIHRVGDMRVCQAIDDRIHHGVAWQTTEYHRVAVSQIEGGRELWGCSDRASFDKHCNKIDQLIESISKQGYRERSSDQSISAYTRDKEILVNISRDGLCLFQDGRHRLAIARALGLKRVPVHVLVRHADWQSFRAMMHNMARGDGGASKSGKLYQEPMHFDFGDISYEHGCNDRWDVIKNNLDLASGAALDIGCNLGYFCHQLEENGYSCIGVEYVPSIAHVARKIATAEDRKFRIVTGNILASETLREIGTLNFDVVIALNIFHHFMKTNGGYERLRQFMSQIQTRVMFFEAHNTDEQHMQGAFLNPSPNEFVQLLKDWGGFERAVKIYTATDGRSVFKLDLQQRHKC